MARDDGKSRGLRLHVIDLEVDGRGSGGSLHERNPALDWAEAAAPAVARAGRAGHPFGVGRAGRPLRVRLEWIGAASPDPSVMENPDPPEWIDVIVPVETALVRVRLRRFDKEPTVRRVAIEIRDETSEVTSQLVRRLGLVEALEAVLEDWSVGRALGSVWHHRLRRPGRRGRPEVEYAEWARRYVEALERNKRQPTAQLLADDAEAGIHRTDGEVRWYLSEARRRGLLTKAPPGKAGGSLTAKARRLLGAGGRDHVSMRRGAR
jgi:hypothetical protein